MKNLDGWQDLKPFGIDRLTGEACAYGMRQLCDLTEEGAALWREFLGLPHGTTLADNWNSRGVASAMIPYDLLSQLSAFALLRDGACAVAVSTGGECWGYYPQDDPQEWEELIEHLRLHNWLERTYNPIGGARVGSRMIHAFTGRVA